MKLFKAVGVVCCGLAFVLVFGTVSAQAECCYFNPLAIPFVVAGAVVESAVALATGFVVPPPYACGGCYGPPPPPGPPPDYYGPPRGYYGPPGYYRHGYGPGYYGERPTWREGQYNQYNAPEPGH